MENIIYGILLFSTLILIGVCIILMQKKRLHQNQNSLQILHSTLENIATQDYLTKLHNRVYLDLLSTNIMKQQHAASILFLDLDHFKSINDLYGHAFGDEVLKTVTQRIQPLLETQSTDFIRLGGDEFLLVIKGTDKSIAIGLAEQILKVLQQTLCILDHELNVTVSIGIAYYPEEQKAFTNSKNFKEVVGQAESALLKAKQLGRNHYYLFKPEQDDEKLKQQSKLIQELKTAIREQQFILYYQPKVTRHQQCCGAEALMRWQHPEQGILSAFYFIETLERTGMIRELTAWTLETAITQIAVWEQEGKQCFPISMNLSTLQFEHEHLLELIDTYLEQYQIQPQHLMIEVTESTAMNDMQQDVEKFKQLRAKGVQIAIDDFGTGYSSFSYLKDLPFDELKIDKQFIDNLKAHSKQEIILDSIIHLAIKLGLIVTVEGVETPEQFDILSRLGCQQFQGYLFAKPMSLDDLSEFRLKYI